MNFDMPKLLSYAELRERERQHPLRHSEIPVEHAVSLPLPTLRFGPPGYALFASPAVRRAGAAPQQAPPDRWWGVDARSGHLLLYAVWQAHPFAPGADWRPVEIPPVPLTLDEMRAEIAALEEKMDWLAPAFFAGAPGDTASRRRLLDALTRLIPAPLLPRYRALVPDFFEWLDRQG